MLPARTAWEDPSRASRAPGPRVIPAPRPNPTFSPAHLARELARVVPAAAPPLASSVLDLVGNTPCIALNALGGPPPRATLLAKLEGRNPGGSVKDRTALGMVLAARASGDLAPGQALVEPTAGNTGIGLALVGRALGHAVTLVMPERYSSEKRCLARTLGARVVLVPGDGAGMRECIERSLVLAEAEGSVLLNQFRSPANPAIHEVSTGPELLAQCGGSLDAIVIGVGTGGTLTGVARCLRRALPHLLVIGVESQNSVVGGRAPLPSRIEGIGSSFVPETLDVTLLDEVIATPDDEAFAMARRAAAEEGLLCGPSGGAILHAALEIARRLGPGRRVATLVPDGSERYWSRGLHPSS